ncbi:hypothetical protein FQN54_001313 [Arachnomyces sp. PD_36]|nr:hypothetical protein FQN54_001313 [Arachnomyces sp. PD_36]
MRTQEARKPYNDWPNDKGFNSGYEERTPVELNIKGDIPSWAAGTLYRTGTGVSEIETRKDKTFRVRHFFDSMAVVHRFQILAPDSENPSVRVLYNSRSTCDGLIEEIKRTGNRESITFAAKYDPCMSYFKKVMSLFNPTYGETEPDDRTMSVTLSVNFPGLKSPGSDEASYERGSGIKTLCNKTDNSDLQMLDPETLEPVGMAEQKDLHPDLKGAFSCAHAKSDPATGDVYNYNMEPGMSSTYRVFHVSASTGKTSIIATIPNADAAYIHSFFLTEHYVILCVWNSFYSMGGAPVLWKRNIVDALADYDPSRPARWYIIDRRTPAEGGKGLLTMCESEPFFCFHTVNAYEEQYIEGTVDVVADLIAYPNLDCLKRFYLTNLMSTSPDAEEWAAPTNTSWRPLIKRFRIASIPSTTSEPTLPEDHINPTKVTLEFSSNELEAPELPTLNPLHVTKPYRYLYGVMDAGDSAFFGGLIKYDMLTHEKKKWSHHGQSAGEPIFVPRNRKLTSPGEEDDGVLLSVVLDGPAGKSYLLVLDARSMVEVGRAEVDGAIGFGLHGTHVPAFEGRGLDF